MPELPFAVRNRRTNGVFRFLSGVRRHFRTFDTFTKLAALYLLALLVLGLVGPYLAPYEFDQSQYDAEGQLERVEQPSFKHLLGTTERGEDVLSRVLYGARPTVIVGLLGGSVIITLGLTIGVSAGYFGGTVESILMRVTDFVYGVPVIPAAIVLLSFFGVGFWTSIVVIGGILWRASARVLRSEVLTIKQRPYVKSAKAMGASSPRIILYHILPNIASMATLFFAFGIGTAIIYQASLAFIGVSDPFIPTWGNIVRNAYSSGYIGVAWWWAVPAGLLISLTVLATFTVGRAFEQDGDQGELVFG